MKIKSVSYNLNLPTSALVCLLGGPSVAYPTIRQADPVQNPLSIAVQFASASATFKLVSGVAQSIDIRVGDKLYTAELSGCTRVENIHFDTAEFFNGLSEGGTFTLIFRMGAENSAAFGNLPLVQITFNHGRRVGAIVTRQTGLSWTTTVPLCRNQRADPSAR